MSNKTNSPFFSNLTTNKNNSEKYSSESEQPIQAVFHTMKDDLDRSSKEIPNIKKDLSDFTEEDKKESKEISISKKESSPVSVSHNVSHTVSSLPENKSVKEIFSGLNKNKNFNTSAFSESKKSAPNSSFHRPFPSEVISKRKSSLASSFSPKEENKFSLNEKKAEIPSDDFNKFFSAKNIPDKHNPSLEISSESKPAHSKKKFLLISSVILVISFLLAGGYFFWKRGIFNKGADKPKEFTEEKIVVPIETEGKYSSQRINYLKVNTEDATAQSILEDCKKISEEIQSYEEKGKIFEFEVVDYDINPIAFPIFSQIFNLTLSPETLKTFGEDFSLYFVNNDYGVRMGIAVIVEDIQSFSQEIVKDEIGIAAKVQPLFLGKDFSSSVSPMKSGICDKGGNSRYLNVDRENNFSVDYFLEGEYFILGTSRETACIILDYVKSRK